MLHKLVKPLLIAAAFLLLPVMNVSASEEVPVNESTFPDPNFREYVQNYIDKNEDSLLSGTERDDVSVLHLNHREISDIKGIEYFTKLTYFACVANQLTSLDVSKNPALTELRCSANQLTSLDVSKNPALIRLDCEINNLTSLDVSENPALTELRCNNNQLTSLDVSKSPALIELSCYYNNLTSLDVSKSPALTELRCCANNLTSLDVSKNPALIRLDCIDNNLTSLDVSKNAALTELRCNNNQLTSLDVSKNTVLYSLSCASNNLMSLDTSKNAALTVLDCNNNQLTSLDVSKNADLTILWCYNNQLTSLDVSKNAVLNDLSCSSNNLTSLDVSKNAILYDLSCFSNNLTSLDVSKNPALTILWCYDNQLTSLDISKNPALMELYCSNNKLSGLDLSHNTRLTSFDVAAQLISVYENLPSYTIPDINFNLDRVSGSYNILWNNNSMICTGAEGYYYYDFGGGKRMKVRVCTVDRLTYDDVTGKEGNWKYDSIKTVTDKGLMGYISSTNSFFPDRTLTRAELVTILYRSEGSPAVTYSNKFSDVQAEQWFSSAVLWAAGHGMVSGYSDGSFGVNDPVTRDQFAKILALYAQYKGHDISATRSLESFTDHNDVSAWSIPYLKWTVESGIIGGKHQSDGTYKLDPKGNATRAEAAKMLSVFLEM